MQEEAGTPMASTVYGYLVVTTLALNVNLSHSLDKDENFSS